MMTNPSLDRTIMRQRWSDLLFLHWPVSTDAIQPLLPPGLTVDTYEGQAYVALVPFRMWNVHPNWFVPVPGVSDLLECNVRTYVRNEDGLQGVWFFSLDASNAVAVTIARIVWHLPYFYATMTQSEARLRDEHQRWSRRISYATTRRHPGAKHGGCAVRYEPSGNVSVAKRNSLEEFLIERYILFAYRNEALYCGRVEHSPYQIQPVRILKLNESLLAAAGIERPLAEPMACYSRNVVVNIYPLRAMTAKPDHLLITPTGMAGQPA